LLSNRRKFSTLDPFQPFCKRKRKREREREREGGSYFSRTLVLSPVAQRLLDGGEGALHRARLDEISKWNAEMCAWLQVSI